MSYPPLSYGVSNAILEYLDPIKRKVLSIKLPEIGRIEKSVPIHFEDVEFFGNSEFSINEFSFKFEICWRVLNSTNFPEWLLRENTEEVQRKAREGPIIEEFRKIWFLKVDEYLKNGGNDSVNPNNGPDPCDVFFELDQKIDHFEDFRILCNSEFVKNPRNDELSIKYPKVFKHLEKKLSELDEGIGQFFLRRILYQPLKFRRDRFFVIRKNNQNISRVVSKWNSRDVFNFYFGNSEMFVDGILKLPLNHEIHFPDDVIFKPRGIRCRSGPHLLLGNFEKNLDLRNLKRVELEAAGDIEGIINHPLTRQLSVLEVRPTLAVFNGDLFIDLHRIPVPNLIINTEGMNLRIRTKYLVQSWIHHRHQQIGDSLIIKINRINSDFLEDLEKLFDGIRCDDEVKNPEIEESLIIPINSKSEVLILLQIPEMISVKIREKRGVASMDWSKTFEWLFLKDPANKRF